MNISRAKNILGWMSDCELTFLAGQAQKAEITFEAGSYQGRSTRAMADNTDGVIYAIDPWNAANIAVINGIVIGTDDSTRSIFYCNLYEHIKSKKVLMRPMEFTKFDPPVKADFIFIDAMHDYIPVKADILHALTILKPGGMIAGHDYTPMWPGVVQAVEEIFPLKFNVTDSIWWLRHG